ncbi:MAG: glycoside hydrolase family 9 protein [Ruminococcus sp.]|nr:glycoside hydrolase family 9 protein [Ruminococcus sp.]
MIVEQATPIPPQSYTVPYGTYLSAIQLPSDNNGRWEWIDSNQTGTTTESPYSYEVKYVPYNNNYIAVSSSVSVTFTKIDPPQDSYTIPNGLNADYGKTLADVNLSEFSNDNGTWTWQEDLSTSVGPAGTNYIVAVYTPNNGNYNSITQSIPITVNKIDPTYTIPENLTAVYGQTLQNITLPPVDNGHWEWENSGNSVGNVGSNTHSLKFVPNDQGNYNTKTVQVVVDVAKADPNYTVPTGLNVKYGSALDTVNLPDGWSWHKDANPTEVITDNAGTELTNLKAVFTPSDTANYNIITKELTVVVEKADPVVNPVYEKKEYTQFESIPLIQLGEGSTSGTIKWHENTPSQLKYGKNVFTWEFTPVDTTNYNTLSGTIEIVANPIPTTAIDIDESVADDFAHNGVNYYYDPDSVMIMPVPEQTPSFKNEYGLVFKKLDENGNLLPGATIQLQSGTISEGNFELDEEAVYNAESELKWDWENGTSSTATIAVKEITLSQLNEGVVYRFNETVRPSEEYEFAKPIYFKKIDDTKVIYTQNESDLADTSKWSELDFENGKYTISMTDKGVYGANITLVKTNADGTVKLNGAKFELYAVNGTKNELVYPLNNADYFEFNDGEVNLYNWFNSKDSSTYNPKYVQNGYLKPGGYYLYEIESPSLAYQRPEGPLYFTIEEYTDDDGNTCYRVNNEKTVAPSFVQISVLGENSNLQWYVSYNNTTMNDQSTVVIEGIKTIKVAADTEVKMYREGSSIDGDRGSYSNGITTFTFDPPLNSKKIEFQNANSWNAFNITNIEIETSSGTVYAIFDPNPTPEDYKIESISLSPITAELIQIRARNGEIDPQWDGYCYQDDNWKQMNGGSNAPVIEGVTSIKVTAETEVKLFSRNHLTGEAINGQTGTHNDNITTFTFNSPIDIDKIEFQPQSGWDAFNISKIEIETSSGKIYTTDQQFVDEMNVQAAKPDLSIKSITVYYLNGDSNTITYETALSASDNRNDDGSYSFEDFTLENNDEIVGMTLVVEGNGTGSVKIGNAWTISGATAGTHSVGRTDYQPPESEEEGDTSHLVNVTDTTITIKNELQGLDTNITAVKTWSGDADFKKYRPESIEVKLYRSVYPTGKDAEGKESLKFVGEISDPDYADFKENATVILNESNGWKYSWKDLPSIYEQVINEETKEIDFEKSKRYYYFVKESEVPDMYDVTYPAQGSASGDYNITNTLKTVDIPVEKIWEKYGNNVALPDSIEVQFQIDDNGTWKNVDNKTITLSEANGWKGTFEDLPSGETYRAAEKTVPVGWHNNENQNSTSSNSETTLTIKNILDVGNLNLVKNWTDDPDKDTRPDEIKFKLYRSIYKMSSAGGDVSVIEPSSQKFSTVTEDYARLLQYSLYFYDAQMCGDEVTQHSVLDWRDNCAVDYQTSTIEGGFHDAGDHLMFGLPQGFTASSLGWTYYEYKDAFENLGLTDHYKVIMKEFCDFFVNSTKLDANNNVESFLYQKGAFDEHGSWGPPEQGAYHTNQEWWTSDAASDIAANYAAALAQYVKNFGDPGNYLKYAEALYRYSTTTNKVATDTVVTENGNDVKGYRSVDYKDEQAWAAAWLYLVTEQPAYKEDCARLLDELGESADNRDKRGYFWGNEELAASCVYNAYIADTADWDMIENYLNKYVSPPDNQGLTLDGDYLILDGWASTRHNALIQSLALAYDKHTGNSKYKLWAQSQMNYILGDNQFDTCFVVGFADNSATSPHHRAASTLVGWDAFNNNPSYSSINGSHTLLGALVGGTHFNNGNLAYTDSCNHVEGNEVALDYNAGLVGAAAALYSVYGSGFTVTEEIMVDDGLELESGMHTYEHKYESQTTPAVYGARNNPFSSMTFNFDTISVLNNNTVEMMYPAYTTPATVTNNQEIRVKNVFSYTNLTKIEVDYTINNSYSGGYDMSILTSNDEVNGYSNGKEQVDENTVRFDVLDWAKGYIFTGFRVKIWNMDSLTINEIRFYYEGTGPQIAITNKPSSETKLKIDDVYTLGATYEGGTVAWESSQPDKVSVVNGVVNVNSYPDGGKVTITAYDANNETIDHICHLP